MPSGRLAMPLSPIGTVRDRGAERGCRHHHSRVSARMQGEPRLWFTFTARPAADHHRLDVALAGAEEFPKSFDLFYRVRSSGPLVLLPGTKSFHAEGLTIVPATVGLCAKEVRGHVARLHERCRCGGSAERLAPASPPAH